MLVLCSSSRNMRCQTCARQGVIGGGGGVKTQLYSKKVMWFRANLIFWFKLPVWKWILTALSLKFASLTIVGLFSVFFQLYLCLYESHWPCHLDSPLLCCLCPHPFLSSHLSSSLLSLCPPSLLSFILSSFSSTPALSNSFYPHSEFYLCPHVSIHPSLLLCPCQTFSNPSTLPCSSMVHLLCPCP